jgi:1-acyl-sn-glycerol-3-phosphate acyltransferase
MLRALIYLVLFIPFTFSCSVCALLGSLADSSGGFAHSCSRFWSKWGLFFAGISLEVAGVENIPKDGPVIYMGNHQGSFDILALTMAIPRRFSWLAKEELFRIPFFGDAMRRAGYIPLDRSDGRRALKSMDAAASRIKSGTSVLLFPEGTRTYDGKLLPFKRGGFLLAGKAGVPIVPFTINGSAKITPRNRITLHPGKISIVFGRPIKTDVAGSKQRDELMELVRVAVDAGLVLE